MDHIFAPEAVFSKGRFYNVTGDEVYFPGAEFHLSMLNGCKFRGPTFTEADFSEARLEDILLERPDLRGTLWRDSYVIAMSVRAKELEGRCYGAAGEGCRGDMRFRRLLMDQSYIDAMYIAAFDLSDQARAIRKRQQGPAFFRLAGGFRSWWPWLCGAGGILAGYGIVFRICIIGPLRGGRQWYSQRFCAGSASASWDSWWPPSPWSIRDPRAKLSLWPFSTMGEAGKAWYVAALSVTLFGFLYAILDGSSIAFTHQGPTVAGLTYLGLAAMGFATPASRISSSHFRSRSSLWWRTCCRLRHPRRSPFHPRSAFAAGAT